MIFELAKVGKERSSRADVRQFAQALITEHEVRLNELILVTESKDRRDTAAKPGEKNGQRSTTLNDSTPERTRTGVLVRDKATTRDSRIVFQPTDFLTIRESVCSQLSENMKKEWESTSDAEFDRAFLKHQIMAHQSLIATIKSLKTTASTEMQSSFDGSLKSLTEHLKLARLLSGTETTIDIAR